jgi:hypothetical protein
MMKVYKDLLIYKVDLYESDYLYEMTIIVLELQSMQWCKQYRQLRHHEISH